MTNFSVLPSLVKRRQIRECLSISTSLTLKEIDEMKRLTGLFIIHEPIAQYTSTRADRHVSNAQYGTKQKKR